MEEKHLMHYGVKGMHWGQRKDGLPQGGKQKGNVVSRTAKMTAHHLAKKSATVSDKIVDTRNAMKLAVQDRKKRSKDAMDAAAARKKEIAASRHYRPARTMTTAELKSTTDRYKAEKAYHDAAASTTARGVAYKYATKFATNAADEFTKSMGKAVGKQLTETTMKVFTGMSIEEARAMNKALAKERQKSKKHYKSIRDAITAK